MNGGEAMLVAVKPEFECGWKTTNKLHPESPAGKFLSENNTQVFTKVEGGLGAGFGSSTAELISANEFLESPWAFQKLWNWYHEHFAPASGADLAVQEASRKEGCGFYHFQLRDLGFRLNRIEVPTSFQMNCLIFHSPPTQKIPTYTDLENKKEEGVDQSISDRFIHRFIESFDPKLLTEWADYLAKIGYESLFAHQVRKSFLEIPGVSGVKGCGAGLNDVFLVCLDPTQPQVSEKGISEVVAKYNLKPLGNLRDHV